MLPPSWKRPIPGPPEALQGHITSRCVTGPRRRDARIAADLHGCTVVIGLTGDSADSGDLHG